MPSGRTAALRRWIHNARKVRFLRLRSRKAYCAALSTAALAVRMVIAWLRSGVRQEILLDVVAVGLEQHAGAAKLTNLLLGPLDHAVALAALGGHHFAGGSHLEALFSA